MNGASIITIGSAIPSNACCRRGSDKSRPAAQIRLCRFSTLPAHYQEEANMDVTADGGAINTKRIRVLGVLGG